MHRFPRVRAVLGATRPLSEAEWRDLYGPEAESSLDFLRQRHGDNESGDPSVDFGGGYND